MKILITGATGFVGTGVLPEALAAPEVERVVVLSRKPTGVTHEKLDEVLVNDFADLSGVADQLIDLDACFWCLGISSAGMSEEDYTRITHTYAVHAADVLLENNPELVFCFLSGSGADGSAMWARVKKRTEEDLRAKAISSLAVFRPAYIRGDHGASMRGTMYKITYGVFRVFSPLIRAFGGGTSNSEIGKAMIVSAREKQEFTLLDSPGINATAKRF